MFQLFKFHSYLVMFVYQIKHKKLYLLIEASFLMLCKETYIPHRALNAKFKLHSKRVPGEHFSRQKGQVETLIESPTMHFLQKGKTVQILCQLAIQKSALNIHFQIFFLLKPIFLRVYVFYCTLIYLCTVFLLSCKVPFICGGKWKTIV